MRRRLILTQGNRIARIVYTSSFLALPPRDLPSPVEANDYQRTKVAADRVADEAVRAGHPIVRVYPGVIYGPGSFTEGNLVGRHTAQLGGHRQPDPCHQRGRQELRDRGHQRQRAGEVGDPGR